MRVIFAASSCQRPVPPGSRRNPPGAVAAACLAVKIRIRAPPATGAHTTPIPALSSCKPARSLPPPPTPPDPPPILPPSFPGLPPPPPRLPPRPGPPTADLGHPTWNRRTPPPAPPPLVQSRDSAPPPSASSRRLLPPAWVPDDVREMARWQPGTHRSRTSGPGPCRARAGSPGARRGPRPALSRRPGSLASRPFDDRARRGGAREKGRPVDKNSGEGGEQRAPVEGRPALDRGEQCRAEREQVAGRSGNHRRPAVPARRTPGCRETYRSPRRHHR